MRHLQPPASFTVRLAQWTTLRVQLIWAYEGPPSYPHHDQPEFATLIAWLIEKGSVDVVGADSGQAHANAGQWLCPAADKISHDFSPDASILSIRFKAHWPNNAPLFSAQRTVVFDADRFPRLLSTSRQLVRTVARFSDPSPVVLQTFIGFDTYMRLEHHMIAWIRAYAHAMAELGVPMTDAQPHDPRVIHTQQLLDNLPLHQRLDEHDLARTVGLSLSQLNRIFVAAHSITPRAYAEKRRLDFARETLLNSTTPIKSIAYLLGFSQASHFSAWFRKHLTVYPTAFRQGGAMDTTRALG